MATDSTSSTRLKSSVSALIMRTITRDHQHRQYHVRGAQQRRIRDVGDAGGDLAARREQPAVDGAPQAHGQRDPAERHRDFLDPVEHLADADVSTTAMMHERQQDVGDARVQRTGRGARLRAVRGRFGAEHRTCRTAHTSDDRHAPAQRKQRVISGCRIR